MNDNDAFIGFYLGPVVQDYKLSPYDPKSLLRGFYTGAQLSVDAWYQPVQAMMIALDGSVASIALIGSARAATGWQISESFYLGPEAQALWRIDYHEWRLGAHITAFRLGGIEWAAAVGAAYELVQSPRPLPARRRHFAFLICAPREGKTGVLKIRRAGFGGDGNL